ncbi:hypothetical protein [Mesorhizobium erdmanii]|uniref:hypothetical protein n=1 Tax=Mesorhizobium erdmanii TaxID=1777866 RepID=UPI001FD82FC8|nr:hypothetical protein [Mesorhizobium erdmanii]
MDADRCVSPATEGWLDEDGHCLVQVLSADPIPEGRCAVDTSVQLVSGLPKFVHELANIPVPDRVFARQFRMQLRISGLVDPVKAWISAQEGLVQDSFEYSSSFVRTEPMMLAGFAKLGFSSEQVDASFLSASRIGTTEP